ncbi:hypothetical protein [Hoylesella oralis]|uniref:hypothetical protein n=1 Tax=Hoylesella oralis TaxID=28134 RepID=UPI0028ECC000|nr:hypothetical protein [Hoylesella oralis]
MKKIICAAFMAAISTTALAQSGTNSPYSAYGLGELTEQSSGFNRGMNGLGLGFREHNQVNYQNPASYSALDSLSFIFDTGLSLQLTNFSENGKKVNANNADFEYVVAGFRAARHVGVSFGIIPFTNVGYNYANTQYVGGSAAASSTTYTNTYAGDGGLHQVYLGAGWEPFKGFSVGVNASYLWGTINRSVINSYSDANVNTLSKYYNSSTRSYKVNFGMQYTAQVSKKDAVTLGVTYDLGHKLNADPECRVISRNTQTGVADTAVYKIENGLELPSTYSAGIMWDHHSKWKIGLDYSFQKWSSVKYPVYNVVNDVPQYALQTDLFKDRHKMTFGGEYCQDMNSRSFLKRIRYRAGVSYATPYLKINGQDGPKELSVSAGFGIPIVNGYNNRSILNISAQWVNREATGLIKENTFRINIGLTFNERWFAKWKVE